MHTFFSHAKSNLLYSKWLLIDSRGALQKHFPRQAALTLPSVWLVPSGLHTTRATAQGWEAVDDGKGKWRSHSRLSCYLIFSLPIPPSTPISPRAAHRIKFPKVSSTTLKKHTLRLMLSQSSEYPVQFTGCFWSKRAVVQKKNLSVCWFIWFRGLSCIWKEKLHNKVGS